MRRPASVVVTAALVVVMIAWVHPAGAEQPTVAPTLSVTPNHDLVDGQAVTVSGSGWSPRETIDLDECNADRTACPGFLIEFKADDIGAFSVEYRVRSVGDRGRRIDCRTDACFVHARSSPEEVTAALDFDPDAPPLPPPTLAIEPDHDLVEGQEIQVTGSGYFPNQELAYGQCTSSTFLAPWDCLGGGVTTDANGAVSFTTTVTTRIFPDHGPIHWVSCHPQGCFLDLAVDLNWDAVASTRVPLRPDGDEQVSVTPAAGLQDGDIVSVDATGLNAGEDVEVAQCVVRHLDWTNRPFASCASEPHHLRADGAGELHTTLVVRSQFSGAYLGAAESFDCQVDECQIVLGGDAIDYQAFEGSPYPWEAEPVSFAGSPNPSPPASPPASPSTVPPRFTG